MDTNYGSSYGSASNQNSGAGNKKLQQTQAQVDEVVGIMRINVEKVLQRDEKLSALEDRADELQHGASRFEQQAKKLKRKYWWQNLKMMIIIGIIVAVILIIIIVSLSSSFSSDSDAAVTVAPVAPVAPPAPPAPAPAPQG